MGRTERNAERGKGAGLRLRWQRDDAPVGAARFASAYVVAVLAGVIGPAAILLLPAVSGTCPPEGDGLCEVSFVIWLWVAGFLAVLAGATWLFRLGWLFLLAFAAQLVGLVRLVDLAQSLWVLLLALLIPATSAIASNHWSDPPHRGWQFWVAVVASVGLIVSFGVWLLG